MPTYTVGSGKTYSTVQAALNAIPSNLSGTGIHAVVIDAGTYSSLAAINITNSNGSATDYIHVQAASGSEHKGLYLTGVRLSFSASIHANYCFTLNSSYARVENIIGIDNELSNVLVYLQAPNTRAINVVTFGSRAASAKGFYLEGAGAIAICCLAISEPPSSGYVAETGFYMATGSAYNCGSIGFQYSYEGFGGVVKNCWGYCSRLISGTDFGNIFGSGSTNNASSDTSAPNTNALKTQSLSQFAFTSVSGKDFHLTPQSTLSGAGLTQASVFTTDIDLEIIIVWSIGPDYRTGFSSLLLAGSALRVVPFAEPTIKPAIQWVQDSAGYWNGSDRGAAQDVYETEILIQDSDANVNALQTLLNSNREAVSLSSFNTDIMAPNVDQTGTVAATVVDFGVRRQIQHAGVGGSVLDLAVSLRAISPTLLATTPSLSSLRLQEGWSNDTRPEIAKGFSYSQVAVYADRRSDIGRFVGHFSQSTTQLKAILAYLLVTARASSFVFPTLSGVTYPFGIVKGAGPFNVKALAFEIRRVNLNRWDLMIDFREAP